MSASGTKLTFRKGPRCCWHRPAPRRRSPAPCWRAIPDHTGHTGELIERTLRRLRAKPQEFLELNSIGAIVELVREGAGVAVLPSVGGRAWAAEPLLQVIAIPQAAESREIALVQLRTAPRAEIIMAMGQHFLAALAESAKEGNAAQRPARTTTIPKCGPELKSLSGCYGRHSSSGRRKKARRSGLSCPCQEDRSLPSTSANQTLSACPAQAHHGAPSP
jgi:hypothetical protein